MMPQSQMTTAFESAVHLAGGQSELSRKLKTKGLDFSQQRLWHHLRVKGACPAELVMAIEELTGVSRHDLRPDVFGSSMSSMAA